MIWPCFAAVSTVGIPDIFCRVSRINPYCVFVEKNNLRFGRFFCKSLCFYSFSSFPCFTVVIRINNACFFMSVICIVNCKSKTLFSVEIKLKTFTRTNSRKSFWIDLLIENSRTAPSSAVIRACSEPCIKSRIYFNRRTSVKNICLYIVFCFIPVGTTERRRLFPFF